MKNFEISTAHTAQKAQFSLSSYKIEINTVYRTNNWYLSYAQIHNRSFNLFEICLEIETESEWIQVFD